MLKADILLLCPIASLATVFMRPFNGLIFERITFEGMQALILGVLAPVGLLLNWRDDRVTIWNPTGVGTWTVEVFGSPGLFSSLALEL